MGFGEAMIRLRAPELIPLSFSKELTVGAAGSELNVLVSAGALGLRTRWLTRLPANELGSMMRRHALSTDVNVNARAGPFFYECDVPLRSSNVISDCENYAVATVSVQGTKSRKYPKADSLRIRRSFTRDRPRPYEI